MRNFVGTAILLISASNALASNQCSKLNAWANYSDTPDLLCISYTNLNSGNKVSIQLLRNGAVLDQAEANVQIQPGGTTCNHHTGECHSYEAYPFIKWVNSSYQGQISIGANLSGTVWTEAHDHYRQFLLGND